MDSQQPRCPQVHGRFRSLMGRWPISDVYKRQYLYRLKSGRHLVEVIGQDIESVDDLKRYMAEIKIYMRGHNLYDIIYGRYKKDEKELLKRYILSLIHI